ncbi:DUF3347 domain-containing protein [Sphingobacterium bambusae]|uniref:DUF3347 domain-containing protein n=1 Tax=Sphingobacterium bambusae TaxID=662858 RepID=A0ABW6BH54_9SPHI|nr:DUF3347 domain-containing protein [Sphingobacterium bambusae]WPL49577.1 DUF3347 domain-containing protein [Sphingobacterium bambusae]
MKSYTLVGLLALSISVNSAMAQIKNSKLLTVQISGNCGMCKSTIEKAGDVANESLVVWNSKTNEATLTYDSNKTSEDAILKRIALAGYDNERYLAPEETYAALHSCCQYDRTLQAEEAGRKPAENQSQGDSGEQHTAHEATASSSVSSLLTPYLGLKDALIAGDSKAANEATKKFDQALTALQAANFSKEEKAVWANEQKKLQQATAGITAGKSIDAQRQAFDKLSRSLYTVLKASKTSDKLYYQHCPMYQDGKGAYWISREAGIKNPYYGAQMLSCGKTVETL